ncbi:MAG: serine/threonine-protein phosphatase, partial [bacterium]
FQNLAAEPDLKKMIQQFNRSLYTMGLQPLLVSLMILRVKEGHLEIVNGGMPGVLIFQKQTNSIQELEAGGPPLGAFVDYPYEQSSLDLARGDIILSMSDGFVEKINEKNEILGFEKCKEILKANASGDAQHMIDQLVRAGETWGENKKAGDDITFVIIKHTS